MNPGSQETRHALSEYYAARVPGIAILDNRMIMRIRTPQLEKKMFLVYQTFYADVGATPVLHARVC